MHQKQTPVFWRRFLERVSLAVHMLCMQYNTGTRDINLRFHHSITSFSFSFGLTILLFSSYSGWVKSPKTQPRGITAQGLTVQRSNTKLANKAFSVAGHSTWNLLPSQIRTIDSRSSYCKQLKTYMFSL